MAERINDDEDNHSDVQGRIPRVLLVIQAITLILNMVWLACVAVVPIVIKAYVAYKVRKFILNQKIIYSFKDNTFRLQNLITNDD